MSANDKISQSLSRSRRDTI